MGLHRDLEANKRGTDKMDRGNNEVGAGLNQVRSPLEAVHPVQTSEKNYLRNREMAEMAQLRKMQGIHAPIRIQMEKRLVTAHQGHLPCMTTRTNLSADILNGTDGTIAFEDFLGQPENYEGALTALPHDVIEAHMAPTKQTLGKKALF